ncbi:MAG: hypothetical protein QM765_13690 [Myxococcales bacterium]
MSGKPLYFVTVAAALVLACSGPTAKPDAGTSCGNLTKCKGVCVDTQTDNENCGYCSESCGTTKTCVKGQCYLTTCATPCTADQVCQSNVCVDKACIGKTCGTGEIRQAGVCKSSCTPDQACTPTDNECKVGKTVCTTGTAVCQATGDVDDGTACENGTKECKAGVCSAVDRCANVTCSGPLKKCDPATGKCVGCLAKADCTTAAKPVCDTSAKKCVECLTETECASRPRSASSATAPPRPAPAAGATTTAAAPLPSV